MVSTGFRAALPALLLLFCDFAHAQNPPFKLPSAITSLFQAASAPVPAQKASAGLTGREAAAFGDKPKLESGAGLADLKPDADCSRPQEGFDVMSKVTELGGEHARLRLERLLATDFEYHQLTPEDHKLLKIVAYNTVWIPPSLESAIGQIYTTLSAGEGEESHARMADRAKQRMDELKAQVTDFPGDIRLVVLNDMPEGATAQAGGLISISKTFLNNLDDNQPGRDLILAHEMSHVYKRHALKEIQHNLLQSSAGFSLAKRLLARQLPGAGGNFLIEAISTAKLGFELAQQVRDMQITFSKDQELEADACAAVWMRRAAFDMTGAWRAFETVASSAGGAGSYIERHPSSDERKKRFVGSAQRAESRPNDRNTRPAKAGKAAPGS